MNKAQLADTIVLEEYLTKTDAMKTPNTIMNELSLINDSLSQFLTDERLALFHSVLENRTRYLTIVLEDIYQSQNASAVLRTSECFGIQDVHIIENKYKFNVNPDVALGSTKWINLYRYNQQNHNTLTAINSLKSKGYRIVATTPHNNDVTLDNFDLAKGKIALFFGTELNGLSEIMLDNADEYLKIPMYGYTESFNISVSAALIIREFAVKMRKTNIDWQLTDYEKSTILFKWFMNNLKKSDLLLKRLCKSHGFNPDTFKALL